MAKEVVKEQEANPDALENKEPKTVEELVQEAIEAKMSEIEKQHRAEVVGRDKKIDALTQERDELKKAQMSVEERLKYEKEIDEREREVLRREVEALRLGNAKKEIMDELGIPSKFANRILGKTEDEIRRDAEDFYKLYASDIDTSVEKKVNERLVTKTPESSPRPENTRRWAGTREDASKMTSAEAQAEMLRQIQE